MNDGFDSFGGGASSHMSGSDHAAASSFGSDTGFGSAAGFTSSVGSFVSMDGLLGGHMSGHFDQSLFEDPSLLRGTSSAMGVVGDSYTGGGMLPGLTANSEFSAVAGQMLDDHDPYSGSNHTSGMHLADDPFGSPGTWQAPPGPVTPNLPEPPDYTVIDTGNDYPDGGFMPWPDLDDLSSPKADPFSDDADWSEFADGKTGFEDDPFSGKDEDTLSQNPWPSPSSDGSDGIADDPHQALLSSEDPLGGIDPESGAARTFDADPPPGSNLQSDDENSSGQSGSSNPEQNQDTDAAEPENSAPPTHAPAPMQNPSTGQNSESDDNDSDPESDNTVPTLDPSLDAMLDRLFGTSHNGGNNQVSEPDPRAPETRQWYEISPWEKWQIFWDGPEIQAQPADGNTDGTANPDCRTDGTGDGSQAGRDGESPDRPSAENDDAIGDPGPAPGANDGLQVRTTYDENGEPGGYVFSYTCPPEPTVPENPESNNQTPPGATEPDTNPENGTEPDPMPDELSPLDQDMPIHGSDAEAELDKLTNPDNIGNDPLDGLNVLPNEPADVLPRNRHRSRANQPENDNGTPARVNEPGNSEASPTSTAMPDVIHGAAAPPQQAPQSDGWVPAAQTVADGGRTLLELGGRTAGLGMVMWSQMFELVMRYVDVLEMVEDNTASIGRSTGFAEGITKFVTSNQHLLTNPDAIPDMSALRPYGAARGESELDRSGIVNSRPHGQMNFALGRDIAYILINRITGGEPLTEDEIRELFDPDKEREDMEALRAIPTPPDGNDRLVDFIQAWLERYQPPGSNTSREQAERIIFRQIFEELHPVQQQAPREAAPSNQEQARELAESLVEDEIQDRATSAAIRGAATIGRTIFRRAQGLVDPIRSALGGTPARTGTGDAAQGGRAQQGSASGILDTDQSYDSSNAPTQSAGSQSVGSNSRNQQDHRGRTNGESSLGPPDNAAQRSGEQNRTRLSSDPAQNSHRNDTDPVDGESLSSGQGPTYTPSTHNIDRSVGRPNYDAPMARDVVDAHKAIAWQASYSQNADYMRYALNSATVGAIEVELPGGVQLRWAARSSPDSPSANRRGQTTQLNQHQQDILRSRGYEIIDAGFDHAEARLLDELDAYVDGDFTGIDKITIAASRPVCAHCMALIEAFERDKGVTVEILTPVLAR